MRLFCLFMFMVLVPGNSFSQRTLNPVNENTGIGVFEHLGNTVPLNLSFSNERDSLVSLKSLINKPTVLSFVYFDCPGLCSPLLDGLSNVIEGTDLELGKDYQVVTVSFNYRDTPAKAREKKETFLRRHSKGHSASWIYLTGDSSSVYTLSNTVGFKFRRVNKDFIHPAAIMVLSPEGKITRYLYGIYFQPFDVKMAVIEARKGQVQPTVSKVLQYCYAYDPSNKRYMLNIAKVAGTIIFFIFLGLTITLVVVLMKKRKRPGLQFSHPVNKQNNEVTKQTISDSF